jgi:UDP-glucose 4-epimerase
MKVLITGVAGFIGSNLAECLLERGHEVVGADDFSFGFRSNIKECLKHDKFRFVEINVCVLKSDIFDNCDMIVHLASWKIPRFGQTLQCLNNNILGLHNILMKSDKIPIVIASTSDVYGKQTDIPFNEKHDLIYGSPDHRRWVYGLSKLIDENFAIGFNEELGKPYNIVRFFNAYGRNCALDWTGGCMPQIISKVLENKTVEIHGDGEQTRCFTYVSDIIDALVKIIEGDVWNEIFNIGNDYMISINNLVDLIYSILNIEKTKKKYIPYSKFFGKYQDVLVRQPDISKAKKLLNWSPKVKLEDGLVKTIEWQRERMGL